MANEKWLDSDGLNKLLSELRIKTDELYASATSLKIIQKYLSGKINSLINNNQNLLHNWYFYNPINQRGKTVYEITDPSPTYTIDRWCVEGSDVIDIKLNEGILFIDNTSSEKTAYFNQTIPSEFKLSGRKCTLSVLVELFSVGSNHCKVYVSGVSSSEMLVSGAGLHTISFDMPDIENCKVTIELGRSALYIGAIKLEFGEDQTLCTKDSSGNFMVNEIPDKQQELAKCQRYFQIFSAQSLRPTNAIDFRPVMRTNPTLSTLTINGDTVYTASADI